MSSIDCNCQFFERFSETRPFNVLELYSGIGGFHYALDEVKLGCPTKVIAMDINTAANRLHRMNMPKKDIRERNLMSLSSAEFDAMNIDLLTMSPPCQPFTRQGHRKDIEDERTNSFVHIVERVLRHCKKLPSFIALENVKGFEESEARKILIRFMEDFRYEYREFLITPLQVNVPNSRMRFYLIARRINDEAISPFPFEQPTVEECTRLLNPNQFKRCDLCQRDAEEFKYESIKTIESYLEQPANDGQADRQPISGPNQYLLEESRLNKYGFVLDIVRPDDSSSNCFTKSYGQLLRGTGSILQSNVSLNYKELFDEVPKFEDDPSDEATQLRVAKLGQLRLRYFSPREIGNLMCFPATFNCDETVTGLSRRQLYQLLGNSINVRVVSLMLKYLLLLK